MRRYADELDVYNAAKGSIDSAKPPKPFPFTELAKTKQVIAKETAPITAAEAAPGPISARCSDPCQIARSQFGFRLEPFADFAYSDGLPTYRPTRVDDNEGNEYLFWKTKEQAAYVPTLDQIRDKVVLAWKMIEARELATQTGRRICQARSRGQSPAQGLLWQAGEPQDHRDQLVQLAFDRQRAVRPRRIRSRGSARSKGWRTPATNSWKTVFNLSPGEVARDDEPSAGHGLCGAADRIRAADRRAARRSLRPRSRCAYMSVAQPDQRQMYLAWLDDLNKDAEVHWLRPADVSAGRRVAAEPSPRRLRRRSDRESHDSRLGVTARLGLTGAGASATSGLIGLSARLEHHDAQRRQGDRESSRDGRPRAAVRP